MHHGLSAQFSAIDTVLSLHYASSITTPKLNDVCVRATSMSGTRITQSTIESILAYFPLAYKIVSHGPNGYDYAITVPAGTQILKFGTQLPLRKAQFERLVSDSIEPPTPTNLAVLAIVENLISPSIRNLAAESDSSRSSSPSTVTSPTKARTSPTKVTKGSLLKNDASKFLFKEKIAAVETSKSGLSLLERIRLKEKKLKNQEPPEVRYQSQVVGKLPAVYDVLYELAPVSTLGSGPKSRSFSLPKVVSIVQDSFSFAIADTEVLDVIRELESRLGQEKVHILERGGVHAIKVFHLDRTSDLSLIR